MLASLKGVLSDHMKQYIKVTIPNGPTIRIVTHNMLNQCKVRNNAWKGTEADAQYTIRVQELVAQYDQDMLTNDIICLQEAPIAGSDQMGILESLAAQKGWAIKTVQSANGQFLASLYNPNVLVEQDVVPVLQLNGFHRGLLLEFIVGKHSIHIANIHADYADTTVEAISQSITHVDGVTKIAVGDFNRNAGENLRLITDASVSAATNVAHVGVASFNVRDTGRGRSNTYQRYDGVICLDNTVLLEVRSEGYFDMKRGTLSVMYRAGRGDAQEAKHPDGQQFKLLTTFDGRTAMQKNCIEPIGNAAFAGAKILKYGPLLKHAVTEVANDVKNLLEYAQVNTSFISNISNSLPSMPELPNFVLVSAYFAMESAGTLLTNYQADKSLALNLASPILGSFEYWHMLNMTAMASQGSDVAACLITVPLTSAVTNYLNGHIRNDYQQVPLAINAATAIGMVGCISRNHQGANEQDNMVAKLAGYAGMVLLWKWAPVGYINQFIYAASTKTIIETTVDYISSLLGFNHLSPDVPTSHEGPDISGEDNQPSVQVIIGDTNAPMDQVGLA